MIPEHQEIPSEASPTAAGMNVERLFREHNAALVRFISVRVGSKHEAQEIAQEAYVQLLRLDRPDAISFLRAFLFKTALNLAIDRIRQRGRRGQVALFREVDLGVCELSPERRVSGEQAMVIFRQAVDELPAKCRQAFLLHRMQEMHINDIAAHMNIGRCMVRRYISRALEHVRSHLDAAGYDDMEALS